MEKFFYKSEHAFYFEGFANPSPQMKNLNKKCIRVCQFLEDSKSRPSMNKSRESYRNNSLDNFYFSGRKNHTYRLAH